MRTLITKLTCILFLLAAAQPIRAASGPTFQLTQASTWLRSSPSLLAPNTAPIFNGERYTVIERTSDNEWLQLEVPKANGQGTWVLRSFGDIFGGELSNVTTTNPSNNGDSQYGAMYMPAYIPTLSARMRQIYDAGLRAGRDMRMFTVIGDCNSEPKAYLGRVAAGLYQLPAQYSYLQGMISQFNRSFSRTSLAARGGYGTAAMFDPSWSDPFFCQVKNGEGPFPCELRFSNASIAFIELGTGDQYKWQTFEKNYRPLIEHAINNNVVPVLVTKADDLEAASGASSGYINDVVRRLAATYDAPLLDFAAAAKNLDNGGLIDEGNADFHLNPQGSDMHLLVTLQTLHALTRGSAGVAPASAPATPAPAPVATTPVPVATAVPVSTATASPSNRAFVVTAPAVNVRNRPGLDAGVIDSARAGATFAVQSTSADGAWVQVGSGRWIMAALGNLSVPAPSTVAPTPAQPVAVVSAPAARPASGSFVLVAPTVNVRNGPGLDASVIDSARAGATFAVQSTSADGAWVQVGSGRWILAALGNLSVSAPSTVAPTQTSSATATTPLPASSSTPATSNWTLNAMNANIRSSPGLDGAIVGGATQGQSFGVMERSSDGAWVRIGPGRWIFAALGE